MQVKKQDVHYIARLARLQIDEKQVDGISQKMSEILEYMSKLDSLELGEDGERTSSTSLSNVLREDNVKINISHEEALSESPDLDSDYFRVPKVIG